MKLLSILMSLSAVLSFAMPAFAETQADSAVEELDPFAPDVENLLQRFDKIYEEETGLSSHLPTDESLWTNLKANGCVRQDCPLFIHVNKSSQSLTLYVNGFYSGRWAVSTGVAGRSTPDFDTHPDGRIYDSYTSRKYPEGDYRGLGNMPYAVFISGGFALHGTPEGNWSRLGRPASHGCIRQHPDNAYRLNRLVRQYGVRNTWVTVD